MPAIGTVVKKARAKKGRPPVVLQLQPDSFIPVTSPADLRQWEADVKKFYGVSINATDVRACETCSGGCSDDCGMM